MRSDIILKGVFDCRGCLSRGVVAPLRVDACYGGDFAGGGADEDFGRRGEVLRGQIFLDELETGPRHNLTQNISGDTRQAARRKWRGQNLASANQEKICRRAFRNVAVLVEEQNVVKSLCVGLFKQRDLTTF